MNKGDKLVHPNIGKCVFVELAEDGTSAVQLPSGEVRYGVTTAWLKLDAN